MSKKKSPPQMKRFENLKKMESILQQATQTLNALEASIFDLQHMQDDIQNRTDYSG